MIVEVGALLPDGARVIVREDSDGVNPPTMFELTIQHVSGREFFVSLTTGDMLDAMIDEDRMRSLFRDRIEAG